MQIQLVTPDGRDYTPLPAQAAFHSSPASYRAYIGGFGSGKTLCGAFEALWLALENPGSFGVITRWSYRELEATSLKTFIDILPKQLVESYNKSSQLILLKNGSTIQGFNLANHKRLTSLNISWFWIDEVTEVEEDSFLQLQGRLRNPIGPRRGFVTGNPNGRDWVWKSFVSEEREDYGFFHAKTHENIYLPQDYYDNLAKYYPADWITRFCEGSFDTFEGQVFPEFDVARHVIPQEHVFPIPSEWPRFRAIDHGTYHPTCCLWAATDFHGNLYIYDILYKRGRLISENCTEILEKTGTDTIDWTVIDPSTSRLDAVHGSSYQDEYRRCGVPTIPGNNNILDGISRIKEQLALDPLRTNPITGVTGSPRLFIFPHCAELIWEMQQYKWIDQKPGALTEKEKPVDRNNHAIDPLRYLLQQRPREATVDGGSGQWSRWQALLDQLRDEEPQDDKDMYSAQWAALNGRKR